MRLFLALAVLVLFVSGCDSGSDSLVLNGTYEGSGEVQISTDADPTPIQVEVMATFDNEAPGPVLADLRVEATAFSTPEVYTGRASGTLGADGALTLSATLTQSVGLTSASGGGQSITFSASGTASASRINVDVAGSLPFDGLVLTRR